MVPQKTVLPLGVHGSAQIPTRLAMGRGFGVPSLVTRVTTSVDHRRGFKGYGPETDRTTDLRLGRFTGNIERLRQLREALKQMPPEVILQMVEGHPNLNMLQALELAKRTGKLLLPNIVHDRVLDWTDTFCRSWTGTMIIYEAPKKPFGFEVNSNGLVFTVPEQFIGKKNCALVVEYPDFDLVKKKDGKYELVVPDLDMLHLVENFPKATNSRYPYNANPFGIPQEPTQPHEKQSRRGNERRRLWRSDSEYTGLLSRIGDAYNNPKDWRHGVGAACGASRRFEVALV